MGKAFEYILKFTGDTKEVEGKTQGLKGLLKGAAVAAGALFAAATVKKAAEAVFNYAQQISELRDRVESLTGVTGAALNQTAGAVQAISNVFEQDVNEVLTTANALSQQFGLSMLESIDLVKKGLASSANVNGDFLNQVKEYSAQFKSAGLEAENMIAIMSAAGSKGIYDDKGADVIKESMLRIREMTITTKDALAGIGIDSLQMQRDLAQGNISIIQAIQQISARLAELPPQSAIVGTAIADIFGGPGEDAGLEYIKMLGTMDMGLQGIMDTLTKAGKAQLDWTEAQEEFHTVGAAVFGGTHTLIMKVKTALLNMVNRVMEWSVGMANYFIDLYNESTAFRGVILGIGAVIRTVFEVGKFVVVGFFNLLKNAANLLKSILTLDFKGVKAALNSGVDDLVSGFDSGAIKSGEAFTKAFESTLNPRKKIALIAIKDSDAQAAGVDAGKSFAKGVQSGIDLVQLGLDRSNNQVSKVGKKGLTEIPEGFADKQLKNSSNLIDLNTMKMEMLIDQHNRYSDAVASSAASISGAFSSVGDAIEGTAGSWLSFVGRVLSQIPQIITQINALTNAQIASSMAITSAKQTEAAGSAAASAAGLPFPANIAAMIAAVSSVIGLFASFASMPKMAKGGAAFGMSSVIVGDYANAQANPEVIAPLDRLKSMLMPAMQPAAIRVYGTLEGRGRDFQFKLQQQDDFQRRTGGR